MDAPLNGRVWVIAHRGASHDAPEHTVSAYDRAVADGADFLETDLRLTADGVLVCFHDSTVDRTSGASGAVGEMTIDELRSLDVGSWFNRTYPDRAAAEYVGERIVTFEEKLDRYGGGTAMRFYSETKHFDFSKPAPVAIDGRMEAELVRVLRRRDLQEGSRVVIQSFHPQSLALVSDATAGALPTALLCVGAGPEVLPEGVAISAPDHRALVRDRAYIGRMHSLGHEVHTWTVDDPEVMRSLIAAGIDGILTNRPAVLRRIIQEEFPHLSAADGPGPSAIRPSP